MLVLTHFKGHTMGGFGGSNKNIGIGCADGRIGKGMIHTVEGSSNMWSIAEEELMERITESSKATVDHFGKQIAYINCLRNMSVSCDCEGVGARAKSLHRISRFLHPQISLQSTGRLSTWYLHLERMTAKHW